MCSNAFVFLWVHWDKSLWWKLSSLILTRIWIYLICSLISHVLAFLNTWVSVCENISMCFPLCTSFFTDSTRNLLVFSSLTSTATPVPWMLCRGELPWSCVSCLWWNAVVVLWWCGTPVWLCCCMGLDAGTVNRSLPPPFSCCPKTYTYITLEV